MNEEERRRDGEKEVARQLKREEMQARYTTPLPDKEVIGLLRMIQGQLGVITQRSKWVCGHIAYLDPLTTNEHGTVVCRFGCGYSTVVLGNEATGVGSHGERCPWVRAKELLEYIDKTQDWLMYAYAVTGPELYE